MDDSRRKILNKYRDSIVQDLVVEYILDKLHVSSVITRDEIERIYSKVFKI